MRSSVRPRAAAPKACNRMRSTHELRESGPERVRRRRVVDRGPNAGGRTRGRLARISQRPADRVQSRLPSDHREGPSPRSTSTGGGERVGRRGLVDSRRVKSAPPWIVGRGACPQGPPRDPSRGIFFGGKFHFPGRGRDPRRRAGESACDAVGLWTAAARSWRDREWWGVAPAHRAHRAILRDGVRRIRPGLLATSARAFATTAVASDLAQRGVAPDRSAVGLVGGRRAECSRSHDRTRRPSTSPRRRTRSSRRLTVDLPLPGK